jgi:hypothetical protein
MHDRSLLGTADVDDATLTAMVTEILGAHDADVMLLDSHVEEFPYDIPSITTAGRYVVRGTVDVDGHRAAYALFVKVVQSFARSPLFASVPEPLREFAEGTVPWRSEPLVYRSDLAERLPDGLTMLRSVGVFDLDEKSASIWLEKVCVVERPWDAERYVRAAYLLGRMSGSPRVAELAQVDQDWPRTLREYGEGRLTHAVLPVLHGEEIWQHPRVAATFDDDLRGRLREAADRAPAYVEEAMDLPQLPAHGDACPNNLLATAGSDDFTLIDFGFWAAMPPGSDLGQLLLGEVQLGREPVGDLAARDDAHLAAYVRGLHDEGCDVPDDVVRRGHALHMLLLSGFSAVIYEGLEGPPAADLENRLAERAAVARFCLDRVEQTST